jgi:hypothetical protein
MAVSFDEEQWRKQWFQPKPPLPDVATVKAAIEEMRSWLGMTQKWADDLFMKTERARSELEKESTK